MIIFVFENQLNVTVLRRYGGFCTCCSFCLRIISFQTGY